MLKRLIIGIAAVLIEAALLRSGHLLAGLGLPAITAVAYLVCLAAAPMRDCALCAGGKQVRRHQRSWAMCPLCQGKGFHLRLGVRVLQPSRAARLSRKAGLPAPRR